MNSVMMYRSNTRTPKSVYHPVAVIHLGPLCLHAIFICLLCVLNRVPFQREIVIGALANPLKPATAVAELAFSDAPCFCPCSNHPATWKNPILKGAVVGHRRRHLDFLLGVMLSVLTQIHLSSSGVPASPCLWRACCVVKSLPRELLAPHARPRSLPASLHPLHRGTSRRARAPG